MKKLLVLLVLLVGCKKKAPEPAAATPPAATPPDEPAKRAPPDLMALQMLARKLAVKDPEPSCEELEDAMSSDPVPTFLYVVQTVRQPPWAPMRAAGCLIDGHAAEVDRTIAGWMSDPEAEGLGRLVLAKLGTLPDEVALTAVKSGLGGSLADATREAAAKDERSAVRDLAGD